MLESFLAALLVAQSSTSVRSEPRQARVDASGVVDMASLGGPDTGKLALREANINATGVKLSERVLRSALPGIRDCALAALTRTPSPRDEVGIRVTLSIGGDGSVSKVVPQAVGSVDDQLLACVVPLFTPLRFEMPARPDASVSYTVAIQAKVAISGSDADKMCRAAQSMLDEGWTASRPQILSNLAARFTDLHPTDAGVAAMESIATTPADQIPGQWAKALRKQKLPAPPCAALETLLRGPEIATAAPDGDACQRACERLRGLAWRRLIGKELETSDKAVNDLKKRRAAARDKGADHACMSACEAGKIDTKCVLNATSLGIERPDIDEGAPKCVKEKTLVSLFDEAVLAEERATASGSCDNREEAGICVTFREEARYGRVGKGAACYIMNHGKLKTSRCPMEQVLGTCVHSSEGQDMHFYSTGSSYKLRGGAAWVDSMKGGCELAKQHWVAPSK